MNSPNSFFKKGDKVTVKDDIRDEYQEVYIYAGQEVEIKDVIPSQIGYEYKLPYGFCVGADDLTKI